VVRREHLLFAPNHFDFFGRPFVKWFTLCYRSVVYPVCLSVCPICDVRELWPNGWTDQDETWHAGRPRPWPHCVRWGPISPPPKGGGAEPPIFGPCCGQMAAWIKMPLDMEKGFSPGDFVLDGDPAPSPKRGRASSPILRVEVENFEIGSEVGGTSGYS